MRTGQSECRLRRIILVPGLLEPRLTFWPLKQTLQKHFEDVECFRDRRAFRRLDESVDRLSAMLRGVDQNDQIGIVTHSFGDWVARQAIACTPDHRVTALVSIAPALRPGLLLHALHLITGGLIPELRVIMDPGKATANLKCDAQVRRLVIWAKADELVLPFDLRHIANIQVERVWASHLSVVMQPNVMQIIENYLIQDSIHAK